METYFPRFSYTKNINSPKWFSKSCATACIHKYNAYKEYIRTSPKASHRHYRHISNRVEPITKLSKINTIHSQINRLLNNPNDNKIFWSTLYSFNNDFNKHSSLPPLVMTDGTVDSDSNSKADLISSIFRSNSTHPLNNTPLPQLNAQYPDIKKANYQNQKHMRNPQLIKYQLIRTA